MGNKYQVKSPTTKKRSRNNRYSTGAIERSVSKREAKLNSTHVIRRSQSDFQPKPSKQAPQSYFVDSKNEDNNVFCNSFSKETSQQIIKRSISNKETEKDRLKQAEQYRSVSDKLMSKVNSVYYSIIPDVRERNRTIPDKVKSYMYLGSKECSENLRFIEKNGISHILNCATQLRNHYPSKMFYMKLPCLDKEGEDISKYFDQSIKFIDDARNNKTCVLVHCIAGVSRSATIVMAYLMKREKMRLIEAYDYVHSIRPIIQPNESFRLQLIKFELALFGDSSVSKSRNKIWNFYDWNRIKFEVKAWTGQSSVDPNESTPSSLLNKSSVCVVS